MTVKIRNACPVLMLDEPKDPIRRAILGSLSRLTFRYNGGPGGLLAAMYFRRLAASGDSVIDPENIFRIAAERCIELPGRTIDAQTLRLIPPQFADDGSAIQRYVGFEQPF